MKSKNETLPETKNETPLPEITKEQVAAYLAKNKEQAKELNLVLIQDEIFRLSESIKATEKTIAAERATLAALCKANGIANPCKGKGGRKPKPATK